MDFKKAMNNYEKIREDLIGLMEIADEQYLTIPSIRAFVVTYDLITANKNNLPDVEANVFCSGQGDINVEWRFSASAIFTLTVNEEGVAFTVYNSPKGSGGQKIENAEQMGDAIACVKSLRKVLTRF